MKISKHAQARSQQRGIPALVIDLLYQFGTEEAAADGAQIIFFDKPSRRRVRAYSGPISRYIEDFLDAYILMSGDTVITVGHRIKHIERV